MTILYANGFETLPIGLSIPSMGNRLSVQGISTPLYSAYDRPAILDNARYSGGQYFSGDSVKQSATNDGCHNTKSIFQLSVTVPNYYSFAHACKAGGGLTLGFAGRLGTTNTAQNGYNTTQSFGFSMPNGPDGPNHFYGGVWVAINAPVNGLTTTVNYYHYNAVYSANLAVPFNPYEWHYYELALVPGSSDSVGYLRLYIDGVLQMTSSQLTWRNGLITSGTYAGLAAGVNYCSTANLVIGKYFDVDDLYISDRLGPTNREESLSEIRIVRKSPSSDKSAQWTRFGGLASNAQSVNVVDSMQTATGITLEDGQAGDMTDLYNLTPTSPIIASSIKGVMFDVVSVKQSVDGHNLAVVMNNGTTTINGATFIPTSTAQLSRFLFNTNPFTNQPFSQNEINTYTAGIRKVGS